MRSDEQFEQRVRVSAPGVPTVDGSGLLRLLDARRRRRRRARVTSASILVAAVVVTAAVVLTTGAPTASTVNVGNGSSRTGEVPVGAARLPAPVPSVTASQLAAGRWSALPAAPIPPRSDPSVVWTGNGRSPCSTPRRSGRPYVPFGARVWSAPTTVLARRSGLAASSE